MSTRIYRAAWLVVAVPVLVAAFSVGRPDALPAPRVQPFFDRGTAVQFASEFANQFPNRSPGTEGQRDATDWVERQLRSYDFDGRASDVLGGDPRARAPGAGQPHGRRAADRAGEHPVEPCRGGSWPTATTSGCPTGADDNASGTGALLELARDLGNASLSHPIVLVSTDGGAYGGLGAAHFAETRRFAGRIAALVNLDAIGSGGSPRLEFAGDTSRVPSPTLLATADSSIESETEVAPKRPGALAQLVDLAFPFSFYEQAPFVSRGVPAVTITTGNSRPRPPVGDTLANLDEEQIGELGRAAQMLLGSLDESAEVASGTQSYLYFGTRILYGWTLQLTLVAALIPFLAATVDLFARCRRRHIALLPALRSYLSRLCRLALGRARLRAVRRSRPPAQRRGPADRPGHRRGRGLAGGGAGCPPGRLRRRLARSLRPRLTPTRSIAREEALGGHLAAMVVLALVALVATAVNPYTLLFLLPSLHAWLWLPQVRDRGRAVQAAVYAIGFLGPFLLFASFAWRFDMGFDAIWYVLALAAVGYVPVPLVLAFLAWGAAAGQVGAVAIGTYAPYPDVSERTAGPLREAGRQAILAVRRSRRRHLVAVDSEEDRAESP